MAAASHRRRLCLVGLNSAWYQSNPVLYYLRGMIADLPYRIQILELTVNDLLLDSLRRICAAQPDILCFSVYIWNRLYLQSLIPELKKLLPHCRIVIGGPESETAEFGLDRFDYIIEGPGEKAFRELAEVEFEEGGLFIRKPNLHLRDIPFPYWNSDLPALKGKLVYYETSRGCPYSCVYCLSAEDRRNELRFDVDQPLQRAELFAELEALISLQLRTLKFIDRSFNVHSQLAQVIWEYVITSAAACEFHFEIYPDLLSEADLHILKAAPPGRIRFEIGIQTTNARISANCHRQTDWNKAREILTALRNRTQVILHTDLIAGLPGETYTSILNSINELAATFPHEIQLGILKVLPGTPMQEIAKQRGYLWQQEPPYQVLATDKLCFGQLCRLQDLARILNLYWNKGEFSDTWKKLLHSHKATTILLKLLNYHQDRHLPLHSMAKHKREQVFAAVTGGLHQ